MEKPRLIASDLDGTLLAVDGSVTGRTAAAVRRTRAAGLPFVLVTGRPLRWVREVCLAAGASPLVVCSNGTVLYDVLADGVVWRHELTPAMLADITSALDGLLPGSTFAAERVGRGVDPYLSEPEYPHTWSHDDHTTASRGEVLGHPAVKLLIRNPEMTSDLMAEAVTSLLGDSVVATYSTNSGLVEISPQGVTKATGLAEVAEREGVDAADVVAFGDMPNDVPMLHWAGHGVAVANAHPEVLAVADEVTDAHSADGVAQVVERWF
ncbi:Cof-type HAD-IIB family hydrolase [Saccharothrix violaceirubra]|uniref:HAD family hydrolase n=1 Tax=Saccharothrix violaceirubra TaxID=413306 RepID=A0A7W7T9Q8_9PSEU|nr:HAD family hydrolase [Saccharothrix violaceirubra]MBB4969134.1 hypothetical protein [Saccharothrix violaceirubra]